MITFDPRQGCWQCDLVQVQAAALTEDVVTFMAQRLQKLTPQTQAVLQLAACVGNQFDLTTLAVISQQTATRVAIALWPALECGLVLPQSEVYTFYSDPTATWDLELPALPAPDLNCRFLHDRIQQAAYASIPSAEQPQTHLTIGQRLLHQSSSPQQEEQLFAIVGHLNQGRSLLTTAAAREDLAQLNLQAGRKAKAATAYHTAVDYLNQGIELLGLAPLATAIRVDPGATPRIDRGLLSVC